jgi:ribosome-associated protein
VAIITLRERNLDNECTFTAQRSSGPGGQNVNKVNTRIDLRFNVSGSIILTNDEKERISAKLKNKITDEGFLLISSQESRSQANNKTIAIEKFYALIESALKEPKKRKRFKMPESLRRKRLEEKRQRSERKALRKRPPVN